MLKIVRHHDFSYGHRVCGHENLCARLHGHNGRVYFECVGNRLDAVGRVIDFKVIKQLLCEWVENAWDHRFLMWTNDPVKIALEKVLISHPVPEPSSVDYIADSLCIVPFNPTAENMAEYLLRTIGPQQLEGTGVTLKRVVIQETRKCAAIAEV